MESTTQLYLQFTLERGSIAGEAEAGGYEGRIDIDSFTFSAKAKLDTLKDIEEARTVKNNLDFNRVTVTKVFDRASLQLARMLRGPRQGAPGRDRKGERFTVARISMDQQYIESYSSDESAKYANEILIVNLLDGCISDIKLRTSEAGAGAQIREDIELAFRDFEIIYYAEDRSDAGKLQDTWRPAGLLSYRTHNRGDQKA
jgi:type VI protein secretion system component Hcp